MFVVSSNKHQSIANKRFSYLKPFNVLELGRSVRRGLGTNSVLAGVLNGKRNLTEGVDTYSFLTRFTDTHFLFWKQCSVFCIIINFRGI